MFYVLVLSTSNDFCKCTGYIFRVSTRDSFTPYYSSWHDTFGFGKLSQRSKGSTKGNQPFCKDSRFYTRHSGEHDYLVYVYEKNMLLKELIQDQRPLCIASLKLLPFHHELSSYHRFRRRFLLQCCHVNGFHT